jgi:hypothetical protein
VLVKTPNGAAAVENSMEVTRKKLNTELPYDSEIPLLGTYIKN